MVSEARKQAQAKYAKSDKGRATMKKYWKTEKGKLTQQRNRNNNGKNWYHMRVTRFKNLVNQYKENGCAICGYHSCLSALDFHHVNPEDKIYTITLNQAGRSEISIIEELNKCILLCSNCHREIHEKERLE